MSGPQLLLLENRTKIERKEIPSRLIPRLLVVFTRQLEIFVTTLYNMDGFLAPISLDNITETYCNRLKPIGKDY